MPYIFLEVETVPGQESMAVTEISQEDLELLNPLLSEIKYSMGWFPTGDFVETIGGSAESTYSSFVGWRVLKKILPRPEAGIKRIVRALLWLENPMTLYM